MAKKPNITSLKPSRSFLKKAGIIALAVVGVAAAGALTAAFVTQSSEEETTDSE